jgi:hypothetical protein
MGWSGVERLRPGLETENKPNARPAQAVAPEPGAAPDVGSSERRYAVAGRPRTAHSTGTTSGAAAKASATTP